MDKGTAQPVPLYLGSVLVNDMVARYPGCDRPLTPWSCETVEKLGRHVHILNKPEQLRGPQGPHRKDGTQNREAEVVGLSVVACVLDIQDNCFSCFCYDRAER